MSCGERWSDGRGESKSKMKPTRRRVMQWASGVVAAGTLGESAPAANAVTLVMAGLFVDPTAAAAVGAAYLRAQPAPGPTLSALQGRVLRALRGDDSRPTRQPQI